MTSPITTHVLDTSLGRPAAGLPVVLEIRAGPDQWKEIGRGITDADGRIMGLLAPGQVADGIYRLTFDTGAYFRLRQIEAFYPRVRVEFRVSDEQGHYHIPLLLSPFGYSTYRGS